MTIIQTLLSAIGAALFLCLLLCLALFISKARRESAWESICLALDVMRNPWAKCQDCGIHHNTKNGHMTWEAPTELIVLRLCPDCKARAQKQTNFPAQTTPESGGTAIQEMSRTIRGQSACPTQSDRTDRCAGESILSPRSSAPLNSESSVTRDAGAKQFSPAE